VARTVILFEDHTAQQFRPLSWSLPVYELPCGLFNLRERVQHLIAADRDPAAIVLLPRGLLTDLQVATAPDGAGVGPRAGLDMLTDDVLFLAARTGADWAALRDLLVTMPMDALLGDAHGPVAWRTDAKAARAALAAWRDWDETCAREKAWTATDVDAPAWTPVSDAPKPTTIAWGHLWDLMHDIGGAIRGDAAHLADGDRMSLPQRTLFGLEADGEAPAWRIGADLARVTDGAPLGGVVAEGGEIWLGPGAVLGPGVAIDASAGPVIIDRDVRVLPNAYLEGPLYLGCGARVKACATLYGETAVGAGCRVSGEIAESQLLPYMNKQHAGFLGHSVVGSWVNLGADTTNSDLKNNYGDIKVNYGLGPVETGSRFVGLMIAEHAKSAIGTTFNTGTTVGFASNVFAAGFPRTCLDNFTWGDGRGRRHFQVDRALEVARIVMSRRDCRFTEAHAALFRALADRAGPSGRVA